MGNVKRPALEGTVAVRGDRRLSFAEYGPRRGPAIIWMHGTPGARRQIPLEAREYADRQGVRIIGLDRPGIGSSTRAPLPGHPGLDPRPRAGARHAGGRHGPGDRSLRRRTVRAGRRCRAARPGARRGRPRRCRTDPRRRRDRRRGDPARRAPRAAALRDPGAARHRAHPDDPAGPAAGRPGARPVRRGPARRATRTCSPAPSSRRCSSTTCSTAAGSRARRALNDLVLFTRHWGFEAADVSVPVRWWHGDADHIVPFRHGEHLVGRLPDATMSVIDGESHLGGLGIAAGRDHHADGARAAAGPTRRYGTQALTLAFQGPMGHNGHNNYNRVISGITPRSTPKRPLGKAYLAPEIEGGHGDRTHCHPHRDEGRPVRPLSAVRAVPAHRVGRQRCPWRAREPGLDAAAGPVRHLPRRAVVDR